MSFYYVKTTWQYINGNRSQPKPRYKTRIQMLVGGSIGRIGRVQTQVIEKNKAKNI